MSYSTLERRLMLVPSFAFHAGECVVQHVFFFLHRLGVCFCFDTVRELRERGEQKRGRGRESASDGSAGTIQFIEGIIVVQLWENTERERECDFKRLISVILF